MDVKFDFSIRWREKWHFSLLLTPYSVVNNPFFFLQFKYYV